MDPKNTSYPNQLNDSFQPEIINPTSGPAPTVGPALTLATSTTVEPTTGLPVTAFQSETPAGVAGTIASLTPEPKKGFPKLAIYGIGAIAVLIVGALAFYFGYYTNSSLVYQQALSNSGKGLTELTDKLTSTTASKYKGFVGQGTFKYVSEGYKTDGKLAVKSDKTNSETTFDVGVGTGRLDFTVRSLKSVSTNPDLYIKLKGLKSLDKLVGPEFGAIAGRYDDQWIAVDHTLLDNAQGQLTATKQGPAPSSDQIVDEVKAFSKVNEEYLFSTDEDKSVLTVLETYGQKSIDGHNVIHYKVGFNKANVKKYISAQHEALKGSKLNDWLKANDYSTRIDEYHKELLKSADDIKSTDSFELYADIKNRIIYKLRFSETKNPALNYVDIGLDYTGQDELPFFVAGKSDKDKTDFRFQLIANSKSEDIKVTFKATSGPTAMNSFAADFAFKPTNETISIAKPAESRPIAEVFKEIGLGDPFGAVSAVGETLGVSTSTKKSLR